MIERFIRNNYKDKLKNSAKRFGLVAIAFVIVLVIFIAFLYYDKESSDFNLKNSSKNITIKYINRTSAPVSSANLIALSEDEIFKSYNTCIFKGEVEDIDNIQINFNGVKDYRAIIKIRIVTVYRGNVTEGKTVSVLLPCSIGSNVQEEDTDTISVVSVGMTGIFMPVQYDMTSICEINKQKLYLLDIAQYGLLDGERFAFIDTDKGLIFSKDTFISINSAKTLDDIENYVKRMIQ